MDILKVLHNRTKNASSGRSLTNSNPKFSTQKRRPTRTDQLFSLIKE